MDWERYYCNEVTRAQDSLDKWVREQDETSGTGYWYLLGSVTVAQDALEEHQNLPKKTPLEPAPNPRIPRHVR